MSTAPGDPFRCEEMAATEALAGLGPYTLAAHDPPWSALAGRVPAPRRIVPAGSMDLDHLDAVAAEPDEAEVIVGLGGGTALDTAKHLAWRRGLPLVQIPSITSVDAAFTDAVGVRVDGRVRYVGRVAPELVVLDLDLVRSAPVHLNRAGVGDVLSCHTGLADWRAAAAAGHGPPWDDELAALGRLLLDELEDAAAEIRAVTETGVRFLADAYRRIGAACAAAGHSRFEEGSEHFWAYALEHATGARHVHGELVALGVVAVAGLQDGDDERPRRIVEATGVRAHPLDLGITEAAFTGALVGLRRYARDEDLDVGVADLREITPDDARAAWDRVATLPRHAVGESGR